MAAYTRQPVLLGFNAADYAKKTMSWSDDDIVADAMSVLRVIYGSSIPQPEGWQLSRWYSDPFARGSYSYNKLDGSRESRIALAESVAARLFFAGEATSADYPATVHGAYQSGLDAAHLIAGL